MPARIEGHLFTLFKDYDQPQFAALSYRGRVRWFDQRTKLVLLRPLSELRPRRRGRRRSPPSSGKLIFGAIVFGGVEALGTFYAGTRGSDINFKTFVHDFMDARWRPHSSALRDDYRNGLAHGLTVKRGGFEFLNGPPFQVLAGGQLVIDPDFLLRDFKRAYRAYVSKLRSDGPGSTVGLAFAKRFHDVYEV